MSESSSLPLRTAETIHQESPTDWADRIARETGQEAKQSDEWLQMKARRILSAAQAFCHYGNAGMGFNSCCSGVHGYRCREAAEAGAKIRFGDRK